jgi:hypothetical protein
MGAVTILTVGSTTDSLSSAAPSTGTAPYTYQWYVGGSSSFTPGTANIITGATALTLSQSGLTAATTYFYKLVATDSASTLGTSTTAVTTATVGPTPGHTNRGSSSEV